jgi:hypothetical protein
MAADRASGTIRRNGTDEMIVLGHGSPLSSHCWVAGLYEHCASAVLIAKRLNVQVKNSIKMFFIRRAEILIRKYNDIIVPLFSKAVIILQ